MSTARVVEYIAGHEPDLWSPDPEESTHRFALGRVSAATAGDPPLIAICMNPSYADHTQADKTVNRLIEASIDNGSSGWLMLNVYPERATNASSLRPYDPGLSSSNCAAIEEMVTRFGAAEVLAAWGNLKHATLRRAKLDVLDAFDRLGVQLYTYDGLTGDHEPRHPTPRGAPLAMQGSKRYVVRSGSRLEELTP